MTLVLDAGAFIAAEHGHRRMLALIAGEARASRVPVTHGGVVGQVWRGGDRQAVVSRLLAGVRVAALDEELGRRAGALLLARTSTSDIIDAALVLLAGDGDVILTSDPGDLAILAAAAGADLEIVRI